MELASAYNYLFVATLILLAIAILLALLRAITGTRTVDRIIGINMICTMTVIAIAILSLLPNQSYLLDIDLIYVMISFIATLLLCKVYITKYLRDRDKAKKNSNDIGGGDENA